MYFGNIAKFTQRKSTSLLSHYRIRSRTAYLQIQHHGDNLRTRTHECREFLDKSIPGKILGKKSHKIGNYIHHFDRTNIHMNHKSLSNVQLSNLQHFLQIFHLYQHNNQNEPMATRDCRDVLILPSYNLQIDHTYHTQDHLR